MMLNRPAIFRLFAAICLLLVTACPGWSATTLYLNPDGSSISPYDTREKAATSFATLLGYGINDSVIKMYGKINEKITISTALSFTVEQDVGYDDAIIDPSVTAQSTAVSITSKAANCKFIGITFYGGSYATFYSKGTTELNECRFEKPDGKEVIEINTGYTKIDRCKIHDVAYDNGAAVIKTFPGGYVDLVRSLIVIPDRRDFVSENNVYMLDIGETGTTSNISNNVFIGGGKTVIAVADLVCTANIRNNIFGPADFEWNNVPTMISKGSAATINESNNMFCPNMFYAASIATNNAIDSMFSGGISQDSSSKIDAPLIKGFNTGYLIMGVDDGRSDYMEDFASTIEKYNGKSTMWIDFATFNIGTEAEVGARYSSVADLAANGHDIAGQRWNDGMLSISKIFDVQYTGSAASCTLTIADGSVLFDSADDTEDVSIAVVSSDGSNIQSYDDARNASKWTAVYDILDALGAVNTAKGSTIYTYNLNDVAHLGHVDWTQATSLKYLSAVDIKTAAIDVDYDETRHFIDEFDDVQRWINAMTGMPSGYNAVSTGVCHNNWTSNALAHAKTVFDNIRGDQAADGTYGLWEINTQFTRIMAAQSFFANIKSSSGTASESAVRRGAREVGQFIVTCPAAVCFFSHGSSEMTIQELDWFLDEIIHNFPGIKLYSQCEFGNEIRTSGEWTSSGDYWIRDYDIDTFDYSLSINSPCIDAGIRIDGLYTDFDGKHIYGLPDIGAYERQPGIMSGVTHKRPIMTPLIREVIQ